MRTWVQRWPSSLIWLNTVYSSFFTSQAFPNSYAKIVANNNRGNFLFEVDRPDDQQLASVFSTAWKRPSTIEFPLNSIQLPITGALTRLPAYVIRRVSTFLRSDHKSFWDRGYAAIFLTDTGTSNRSFTIWLKPDFQCRYVGVAEKIWIKPKEGQVQFNVSLWVWYVSMCSLF